MKVTIYTPNGSGIYDFNTLQGNENDYDYWLFDSKEELLAYIGIILENCNKIYTGVKGEVLKQLVKADWKQESFTSSNLIDITQDRK